MPLGATTKAVKTSSLLTTDKQHARVHHCHQPSNAIGTAPLHCVCKKEGIGSWACSNQHVIIPFSLVGVSRFRSSPVSTYTKLRIKRITDHHEIIADLFLHSTYIVQCIALMILEPFAWSQTLDDSFAVNDQKNLSRSAKQPHISMLLRRWFSSPPGVQHKQPLP